MSAKSEYDAAYFTLLRALEERDEVLRYRDFLEVRWSASNPSPPRPASSSRPSRGGCAGPWTSPRGRPSRWLAGDGRWCLRSCAACRTA
jgi:hypothetical protein